MDDIYYTYLLRCWKNRKSMTKHRPLYGHIIYCGYTYNIFQRLVEHIMGKGNYNSKRPSYTKQFHGNIKFAYLETFKTRAEAMKREGEIKDFSRDKKVELIYNFKKNHPEVLEFIETNLERLLKK
jgi:putative endonuclease